MLTHIIRIAALAILLASGVGLSAAAQTMFPSTLTSVEWEAVLLRAGVPESQRDAAMGEYDRYQKAMSELRRGAIEEYLEDVGSEHGLPLWIGESESATSAQSRARAYRALLAQVDALHASLLDRLASIGADQSKLAHVRDVLEARRLLEVCGSRRGLNHQAGDLETICGDQLSALPEAQRQVVVERIIAREPDYLSVLRALRTAAVEEPLRSAEAMAKAPPPPEAIDMEARVSELAKSGAKSEEFDAAIKEFQAEQHNAMRARFKAKEEVREPTNAARKRVGALGAGILRDAFADAPLPLGMKAWMKYARAMSNVGGFGGAATSIALVDAAIAEQPLTQEQVAALSTAFASWQAAVSEDIFEANEVAFIVDPSEGLGGGKAKHGERASRVRQRTRGLEQEVRAALGLPPLEPEPASSPDSAATGRVLIGASGVPMEGAIEGGDGTAPQTVVEAAVFTVAVEAAGAGAGGDVIAPASITVISDGGAFEASVVDAVQDMVFTVQSAGDGGDIGVQLSGGSIEALGHDDMPAFFHQGPQVRGVTPFSTGDLQRTLDLCGMDESLKPVAQQIHADYLERATAIELEWRQAPRPFTSFDEESKKEVFPTAAAVTQYFETLRSTLARMQELDAQLFADLGAVFAGACLLEQQQVRERDLLSSVAELPSASIYPGPPSAGRDKYIEPNGVIAKAQSQEIIDGELAKSLRAQLARTEGAALRAALQSWVDQAIVSSRELTLIDLDLWAPTADAANGAIMQHGWDPAIGERQSALGKSLAAAQTNALARMNAALDALTASVPEGQRKQFGHLVEEFRDPTNLLDRRSAEPVFKKALASEGVNDSTAAAIRVLRDEYQSEYDALRTDISAWSERARKAQGVQTSLFSAGTDWSAHEARTAAERAAKESAAAGRILRQLKFDREELNRRAIRRLKPLLPVAFVPSGDNPDQ